MSRLPQALDDDQPSSRKGENFTMRVPVDLMAYLRTRAADEGRSVANLMVKLLRRGLAERDRRSQEPPER